MVWLITGGAGFIGTNLVEYVLDNTTHKVVIYDALTYAHYAPKLAQWPAERVTLIHGRLEDTLKLQETFDAFRPTGVIHLAAESHVDRSIADPLAFASTNVVGTTSLFTVIRRYMDKAPAGFKVVNVSTDEVYGDLPLEAAPRVETDPFAPSSPYSASKAAQDQLGFAFCRTYGLPIVTVRLTNVFGCYQHDEKLIACFMKQAIAKKPMGLYGDGLQSRDWLFARDAARALIAALEQGEIGQAYNLGAHREITNLSWARAMAHFCQGIDPTFDHARLITTTTDRPGHDRRYALNADKARRELGWQASPNFLEQAFETLCHYATRWGAVLPTTVKGQSFIAYFKAGAFAELHTTPGLDG